MTFVAFDSACADMRDRISVRDFVHEVEIGAFQSERGTTQRVGFNVVVEVSGVDQPIGDDVDRILSYDTITDAIALALSEERLNLLETLAERIATLLLAEPQAQRVYLQIQKLDRGPFALGVEIVRDKPKDPIDAVAQTRLKPVVVHLSDTAIHDARLSDWLDQLETGGAPVVLTVDSHPMQCPTAQIIPAQRRIDLLAIEQNAWVLSGLDPRCVVVGTRTEIDWALGKGQIIVWAPSKMVLDAVERPAASRRDARGLAAWFARTMHADRLLFLGGVVPDVDDLPVAALALSDHLDLR